MCDRLIRWPSGYGSSANHVRNAVGTFSHAAIAAVICKRRYGARHLRHSVFQSCTERTIHRCWRGCPCRGLLWLGDAVTVAVAAAGEGVTIFDNIVPNGGLNPDGGSPASQYDAEFSFEAGAADDFVLPASPLCRWTVTDIRWSGIYWGPDAPSAITQFRIIIWPDVDGAIPVGTGVTPDLGRALVVHDIPGDASEVPDSLGFPNAYE